ncbi:hypothetical protein CONLIGDRAFT_440109 [Coniochaeta ligniaria NRRL 30616]|uniref:WD40 repeat-like protein n=1 Tax=Coniochaeta ligniaria NRRL 30616 TaxID=1408157 RepID=A0A1J7IJM6_9PEZI|nr:hypothetical protein CONLIGDRAFT_440109 [Coniochaeta ligniaria NRRL 30616]
MEPREIPGYYYDTERKKYFKIVTHAPPTAAYSVESVKRRKIVLEKEKKAQLVAAQKKKFVQRSRVLQDSLIGGLLATEHGIAPKDVQVDCWAKGLCYKGFVPVAEYGLYHNKNPIEHLYIDNSDNKTGLGVAIGSWAEGEICGAYIPRDEHDRIVWDNTAPFRMQGNHYHQGRVPQISSLRYHQPSNTILMTSREPGSRGGLYSLSPTLSESKDTSIPAWNLEQPNWRHLHSWPEQGKSRWRIANTCAPAPAANSNLICVIGTSRGLGCFSGNGRMLWLHNLSYVPRHLKAGSPPSSDILSVDFLPCNPQVVVTGIRGSRRICLADLRQSSREWEWMTHRSSPAHVRCLDEHRVLAAGPDNSMSIYDLRFRYSETLRNKPLVVFPDFKNAEQIHFGLDIDASLGVVATGNPFSKVSGRPTISIFSLETGRRLKVPALEKADPALAAKALMFQTLPGETNASLFVGGTSGQIHKYSFGGDIDEWTGERFDPPVARPW